MPSSKPTRGVDNLLTLCPEIALEWHPSRNGELGAEDVKRGSSRKVWWRCKNDSDHEWLAAINNRTNAAKKVAPGCPICAGKAVAKGYNDLRTTHPDLSEEWDTEKNESLTPNSFTKGSNQKIWWRCKEDTTHTWQSAIKERTRGYGCPYCSGNKVLQGNNDFESVLPELANEWHPTKNKDLLPSHFTRNSTQTIWWRCSKHEDHEWTAKIYSRSNGKGCPICDGKKVLAGFNDLETTYPQVALTWHKSRNSPLLPSQVASKGQKKVWWRCNRHASHEWQASIASRTAGATGCPICTNITLLQGFNDIQTTHPEIAQEWHPIKNNLLKPRDFFAGSHRKIWWQCAKDPSHTWNAQITSRCYNKSGCPKCSKHGYNPGKPGFFYLMERPGEQQFGVTNDPPKRLGVHANNGWTEIEIVGPHDGDLILRTENQLKTWLKATFGNLPGTRENWLTTDLEIRSLAELKSVSGITTNLF